MQTKRYELTILTKENEVETIKKYLKNFGVKNYKLLEDGYKNLAYSIQGCEQAYYYFVNDFELTEEEVNKMSGDLMFREKWVLRFLLVAER